MYNISTIGCTACSYRVMSMLDDAKADPALLRVVLQELCGPHRTVSVCSTQGGGACASEGYARSTLKDLPVPSPRAGERAL